MRNLSREEASKRMKERWKDPEFREKMREIAKSNWTKGLTTVSFKGRSHNEKTKTKMSFSRNKYFDKVDIEEYRKYHIGKKQTEATKEKHSILSKRMWENKEWATTMKLKLKESHTPESNIKISQALKGIQKSPEHNKKVSESVKKWWQNSQNRKKMIGENAYQWKNGITPLRKQIRHCSKYKEWRISIMKRGDYTCKKCSERGGWKEVDHYPITFEEILEKYKITSLEEAINCLELWEISNGRTLCRKCHRKYHAQH